jgi:putative transposase
MPHRLKRWDEPGHVHFWTISCYRRLSFFWHDAVKQVVLDGLRRLQQEFGICLVGYVVMPEHVHILLLAHARGVDAPIPVARLLHSFKRHVAYYGKAALRDLWREHRRLWAEPLNQWALGADHRLWHKRGYDFNVTHMETLLQKLDYCHKNPVARGLVDRPEQYRWSSYRYYELQDRSALLMDWDGQWPIVW